MCISIHHITFFVCICFRSLGFFFLENSFLTLRDRGIEINLVLTAGGKIWKRRWRFRLICCYNANFNRSTLSILRYCVDQRSVVAALFQLEECEHDFFRSYVSWFVACAKERERERERDEEWNGLFNQAQPLKYTREKRQVVHSLQSPLNESLYSFI